MIFRTLLIFLKRRFLKKSLLGDKTTISMRVLPSDLDYLWHVNNGVYFSYMDFGRWDMIFRNGVFDKSMKLGWYSVVAGETIKFKKSLRLWDKFQIETHIRGYDTKYFYIQQKFFLKNELMANGLVKIRFLKRQGGGVDPSDVLDLFKGHHIPNEANDLSKEWMDLEGRFLV